ncbi:hypothetical protein CYY_008643 [Polysphondylium violaceum]|uniref:EGF-like domain-containing protein n=1 Tax=Polysphondylium violaceum TaxID=133409 RepID=A0A8J4UWS3_9MYCE|nr:hypothetical protein CYY_008643 [Polysphondylium violaceum]
MLKLLGVYPLGTTPLQNSIFGELKCTGSYYILLEDPDHLVGSLSGGEIVSEIDHGVFLWKYKITISPSHIQPQQATYSVQLKNSTIVHFSAQQGAFSCPANFSTSIQSPNPAPTPNVIGQPFYSLFSDTVNLIVYFNNTSPINLIYLNSLNALGTSASIFNLPKPLPSNATAAPYRDANGKPTLSHMKPNLPLKGIETYGLTVKPVVYKGALSAYHIQFPASSYARDTINSVSVNLTFQNELLNRSTISIPFPNSVSSPSIAWSNFRFYPSISDVTLVTQDNQPISILIIFNVKKTKDCPMSVSNGVLFSLERPDEGLYAIHYRTSKSSKITLSSPFSLDTKEFNIEISNSIKSNIQANPLAGNLVNSPNNPFTTSFVLDRSIQVNSEIPVHIDISSTTNIIHYDCYFPFGYVSGNSKKNYTLGISHNLYHLTPFIQETIYPGYNDPIVSRGNIVSDQVDDEPPFIHNVTVYRLDAQRVTLLINATDNWAGILSINVLGQFELGSEHLVIGTMNDGLYSLLNVAFDQLKYDPSKNDSILVIKDYAGNERMYPFNSFINQDFDPVPALIPFIDLNEIIEFKIDPQDIDPGHNDVDVSVLIKSKTIDRSWEPLIALVVPPYGPFPSIIARGNYSGSNDDFLIRIKIPRGFYPGQVQYYFNYPSWTNQFISGLFPNSPSQTKLNVKYYDEASNKFDFLAPIIKKVSVSPAVEFNATSTNTVSFALQVEDAVCGIKRISVNISSSIDPVIYTFSKNYSNSLSEQVVIDISVGHCLDQTFEIVDVFLEDGCGHKNFYHKYLISKNPPNPYFITPMWISDPLPVGRITCKNPIVDTIAPTLVELDVYPKTLQADTNVVSIRFTVKDKGDAGINRRSKPTVYFQSSTKAPLAYVSVEDNVYNKSCISYSVMARLPYGYGDYGILLSIYGLMDNNINFKGYTSSDLASNSFDSFLLYNSTLITAIKKISPVTTQGGSVTVYGTNLSGKNITAYFRSVDGTFENTSSPLEKSLGQLVFQIPPVNVAALSLSLDIDGVFYTPPIIEILNYVQSIKPCSNNCTNRGVCTERGCECTYPHQGSDCSSIIVPPDKIEYSFGNYNPEGVQKVVAVERTLTSTISLFGIREVDHHNKLIKSYSIAKWHKEEDQLGTTYTGFLDAVRYPSAQFKISVQYYKNPKQLDFAGERVLIDSNSFKFTITSIAFPFSSQLNNIQIILKTSLKSDKQTCYNSTNFGYTNSDETEISWLELNSDDYKIYGKFIKKGIIDDIDTIVRNSQIPPEDPEFKDYIDSSTSLVALYIPYFKTKAVLDPPLALLMSSRDEVNANNNNGDNINNNNNNRDYVCSIPLKTKTNIVIVTTVAVACVLVLFSIILAVKYRWAIKYKSKRLIEKFKERYQNHNKKTSL